MELYKREKYLQRIRGFYDAPDLIKVITGVRRCGKSSLMHMIADEILKEGVSEESIIFLDLDSRGYRSIKTPDGLDALLSRYDSVPGLKYLFIDEIQNVKGFEEVINSFREDGHYSIFITGSNSYLLSGELATKLTGRYLEFEMFPLTFDEYEGMKAFYGVPISTDPDTELANFIQEGGFPRTVLLQSISDKRTYTESVIKEIFEKDIRKRVKIKNREVFELLRSFVIANYAAPMSISSLYAALKKHGINIGRNTVARYLSALVDAKVLYECSRFDIKSKKGLSGEKKYYLADLSFYYSMNTDNRMNYGPSLENIVYLYAKSLGYSVSIGKIGNLECDFILRGRDLSYSYVQVAYSIAASEETEEREYRVFRSIRDNYPKYLLTTDKLLQKRDGILHCNLIRFMQEQRTFS